MELSQLLDRCRSGDELAWEALVRRYQSRIYSVAYYYVGNSEDARDLAQEVFLHVYRRLSTCTETQRFLPWMICITRNACIDYLRRKKARPPSRDVPAEEALTLPTSWPDPEQNWAQNSRKQLVHRALRELSHLNREIIVLKEIQGLALEEIAALLDIPLGTVKSRSNRARLELADKVRYLTQSAAAGSSIQGTSHGLRGI